MIEETLAEAGEKMDKTVEAAKAEFAKVRTGRVNPGLFSSLTADYYGAPTPLQQLVSFNVEDARTVKIVPFDVTALAAIEFELVVEVCAQIYAAVAVYAADFFKELKPVFFVLV